MLKAPITHVVRIAEMMNLSTNEAIVLPSYITAAAKNVRMSEWNFANELLTNKPLRDYVAGVLAKVAAENADIFADM